MVKEKVKNLPACPGVYIMKGDAGQILYVGKAKNLKRRVSSYFYPARALTARIELMVRKIKDISYLTTSTEAEALIYENGLIKKLSPKYNVALRDDKSYPMLKLTVSERFPRLFITRKRAEDGSIYYGPYSDAKLLREAVIFLRQMFPLRSCGKMPHSPCLNYHIKQCFAPCAGKIDDAAYADMVSELRLFLEGKREELLGLLSKKMAAAAASENFELAAVLRGRLEALGSIKDKVVHYGPLEELRELRDVLNIKEDIDTIEAFDISNIMGKASVGSMVCFYKGKPKRSEYRKFKIRLVSGIDDYAMIREIVNRRYSRLISEDKKLPDLILIDGGLGHLRTAVDELKALGLDRLNVISIAKEFEHIYSKDRKDPIILPRESKALHLLERIRDEAHRFAITYHKGLMSKDIVSSGLDEITGVGPKRKTALLNYFGSMENMKLAKVGDILKIKGLDEKTAHNIIKYFKK